MSSYCCCCLSSCCSKSWCKFSTIFVVDALACICYNSSSSCPISIILADSDSSFNSASIWCLGLYYSMVCEDVFRFEFCCCSCFNFCLEISMLWLCFVTTLVVLVGIDSFFVLSCSSVSWLQICMLTFSIWFDNSRDRLFWKSSYEILFGIFVTFCLMDFTVFVVTHSIFNLFQCFLVILKIQIMLFNSMYWVCYSALRNAFGNRAPFCCSISFFEIFVSCFLYFYCLFLQDFLWQMLESNLPCTRPDTVLR